MTLSPLRQHFELGRRAAADMAYYTHGMLDLEALVAEVAKHPLLYKPGHCEQRDFYKRTQAWKAIAKAMNATPATCKRQWRSVRDRFVREERLSRAAGQQETEEERLAKWGLYKHLDFLAKVYKSRPNGKRTLSGGAGSGKNSVRSGRVGTSQPLRPSAQAEPLQAAQLMQSLVGDKGAADSADYDAGSECVILHPDVITQSVLLSMVNVPSPDEIIVPDQPSPMDVQESRTNCGAASGQGQTTESSQRAPAGTAFDHVTIKEEPLSCVTSEEETAGSGGTLPGGDSADTAGNEQTVSHPGPRSPVPRRALRRKPMSNPTTTTRPRRTYDVDDVRIRVDDEASDGEDTASTNALLRHLEKAMERIGVAAGATEQCRLPHVDLADSDTMFLLSLRERLRNFGPRERSLALVKIQAVLHEIEFGTAAH